MQYLLLKYYFDNLLLLNKALCAKSMFITNQKQLKKQLSNIVRELQNQDQNTFNDRKMSSKLYKQSHTRNGSHQTCHSSPWMLHCNIQNLPIWTKIFKTRIGGCLVCDCIDVWRKARPQIRNKGSLFHIGNETKGLVCHVM